jgi:LuxR family transcriptional regulator, maltose regulon positive regulatory protein
MERSPVSQCGTGPAFGRAAREGPPLDPVREATGEGAPSDETVPDPGPALFESKLRPPRARSGIVPRAALLDGPLADPQVPLTVLSAPVGYGKTTALAQWLSRQPGNAAWLSLDRADNDPAVLIHGAAVALHRAGVVDDRTVEALRTRRHSVGAALATLSVAMRSTERMTLVLDQLEAVDDLESLGVVSELIMGLPEGCRMAVATRARPPTPTPLMRTRGDVVEIGVGDLAMGRAEATALFAAAGVGVGDADVELLVEQTEGWPVGLYLAALAVKLGRPAGGAAVAFRGDDRLVSDYVRAELFAELPASTVEFLTRTSVLDHLSGPLCDAVLGRHGSQQLLESFEASNLLIVPLDRHREWYRYHRLFRELLLAELRRTAPHAAGELHARAGRWLEAHRMPEAAIVHARQAGDADWVARLVTVRAQPAYAEGRVATVRHWFDWFHRQGLIDRFPNIAVLGAFIETLQGNPAGAERWAIDAERGAYDGELPDGSSIDAWRAYLRALATRGGVAQMRRDARAALDDLGAGSAFRAGAMLLEALSFLLDGDTEAAEPLLEHTAAVGQYFRAFPAAVVALAERALLAVNRDDWEEARRLAAAALTLVTEHHLDAYLEAAPAYVAGARVALHDHDRSTAEDMVAQAARLRPLLTYAVPATALFQFELARTYLALADPSGARTVLRELRDSLRQRPDLGVVPAEADGIQSQIDAARVGSIGASSLTAAELRLLPYLVSHLTFQEISRRLYVSRNTVKSQSVALYRKLGVSSRGEAVQRAREIGLLNG